MLENVAIFCTHRFVPLATVFLLTSAVLAAAETFSRALRETPDPV